ncbi:AI-2E family transporter [Rothia sp. LK2588]|uniref:AI-2E family transporter n=1 Tax=Rothia sp. LK2588 TaxID=3114369 RepID=UPI0034CE3ADE
MSQLSTQDKVPLTSDNSYTSSRLRLPFALHAGAEWGWRFLVIVAAAYCLWWGLSKVSLIIVSVAVAALLAGLISPVVYFLRKHKVRAGLATAITEIGLILIVLGLFALVGQQLVSGISALSEQIMQGYTKLLGMLPPELVSGSQAEQYLNKATSWAQDNSNKIVSGVATFGATAGDVLTGTLITLFTLIFFLMEGERIWLFLVKLFPREARPAVNGAGRRGWHSLVSYVRVQVLVAAIDALGIGLAAFFLKVPLALPLAVLVFLASFIPVVGAVASGMIAALLALVANGPVNALLMLGAVILVQQIESNILQPLVMGKAVSLHPLAVLLAVAIGSMLFGVIGALFAVPVLAVMNTVTRYLADRTWETDSGIRTEEFLYPHEVERKKKKAIASQIKERLERAKENRKHGVEEQESLEAPRSGAGSISPK